MAGSSSGAVSAPNPTPKRIFKPCLLNSACNATDRVTAVLATVAKRVTAKAFTETGVAMDGSVTVSMQAPANKIWNLIADVRNTGRFSPEVMEAEWLGGATGPALGARFRGHVKRNEIGPVYWTTCEVTACEPGREFGFAVLLNDKAVNNW